MLPFIYCVNAAVTTLQSCDTLHQALTYYGDFNSWEVAQQLKYNMKRLVEGDLNAISC